MEKNYTEIKLDNKRKGNWMVPAIIIVFVALVIVLVLALWMRGKNQEAAKSLENFVTSTSTPTLSPTPGIEQELNNIDLGTDSADFETIQEDINQL